jgi:hypothetical protein
MMAKMREQIHVSGLGRIDHAKSGSRFYCKFSFAGYGADVASKRIR